MESFDLAVIGGGVIGCATLRACLQRFAGLSACLIEQEPELAMHQSGRNSGVVHAGYNQKPGSVKARYVVEGNRRVREYCKQNNIPLIEDGILVVAKNESEISVLHELHSRGKQNGANVEVIDQSQLRAREPHSAGIAALLAADACSFDSRGYVLSLSRDAKASGAQFFLSERVETLREQGEFVDIKTDKRALRAKIVLCAGGLWADRLAHQLNLGLSYKMVPFRGEYHELTPERRSLVRSHIYPAPNLAFPFLGVHLSRTFEGRVLVGPGAVLALGRRSYKNTQIDLRDCLDMLTARGFWKLWLSKDFRQIAAQEWRKSLFSQAVTREAQQLVPELQDGDLVACQAGIRAQLVSEQGQLVEDLVVEESPRTVHVLNAVSPALTCSLPFADRLTDIVAQKLSLCHAG